MKITDTNTMSSPNDESIQLDAIRWHEQLRGETDAKIEQAFDDWMASSELHRQAYLEAELLAEGIDQLAAQPEIVDKLLSVSSADVGVSEGLDEQVQANVIEIRSRSFVKSKTFKQGISAMAVAACLAMVTIVSFSWFDSGEDSLSQSVAVESFNAKYHSDIGELKNIELPDGSTMILGPNSLINVSFSESNRKVELVLGEVYFDVARAANKPFFVEADQTSVKVVGTRFDVRKLANSTSVSVVEGVVEVFNGKESARLHSSNMLATTLLAGQYAVSDGKADIVVHQDIQQQDLVAWVDGRLVYRSAELRDVLTDANRYSGSRNIRLRDPYLGQKKVTLSVNVDNINDLPLMLAELMNLEISQNSTETVLSSKR